jgi:hypothetical protein
MHKQYHNLNGDCLKEQFPKQIEGAIIVARECFVDGDVRGTTHREFFENRARFITSIVPDYSMEDYFTDTFAEFQKIQAIPANAVIHLWFEDDLFCQVNFWFTVHLILNSLTDCHVYLIRPATHTPYGFGGLSVLELISAYKQKTPITELDKIANLWNLYQTSKLDELVQVAQNLQNKYPFILEAVKAHIERIPNERHPGRPVQTLLDIMNELETDSFGVIFKEFNRRESIYGFGDLLVKRMYDQIRLNR